VQERDDANHIRRDGNLLGRLVLVRANRHRVRACDMHGKRGDGGKRLHGRRVPAWRSNIVLLGLQRERLRC
jgi:hypothetical protein